MTAFASYRKLDYTYPTKEIPAWASQIDRWYQLDAFAYGLTEAYFRLKYENETQPDFILLASVAASNETDFQFAHSGATSPSKFVHTLPNIRGSTLCQIMQWKGPLLCIQHDPQTQITALREAMDLLSDARKKIWIWSVSDKYCVHWLEVCSNLSNDTRQEDVFEIRKDATAIQNGQPTTDAQFQQWLKERSVTSFGLPGGYVMKRVSHSE